MEEVVQEAYDNGYEAAFDAVKEGLRSTWLWLTVALIAVAIVGAVVIYCVKRDALKRYAKVALVVAIGYAIGIIANGLALEMVENSGSYVMNIFIPLTVTVAALVLGAAALAVVNAVAKDKLKLASILVGALVAVPLVVTLVYLSLYYVNEIKPGGYYVDVSTGALVGGAVALVAIAAVIALVVGRKTDNSEHTKSVAYAGVCIALSFALSYVRFFRMPQGGSITLVSMLPIMLYSCRFGTRKGLMAGLVYGFLQAVQDPWIIHPAQLLLDYPVAFMMLGLAGWARECKLCGKHEWASLLVGGVTAVLLRYASHVISGIFAFAAYAEEGYTAVAWGFLYNTFVLVDGAIALVAGGLLYANKGTRRMLLPPIAAKAPVSDTAVAGEDVVIDDVADDSAVQATQRDDQDSNA